MQSNLFNHSVWYLQLSKNLGYSPPHASHSCISFRQEITDLVAREGGSEVMQGESSGWTSSALEPLPAVGVSSVCSIGAVAIEQFWLGAQLLVLVPPRLRLPLVGAGK